jgi:hypothetical protein
MQQVHCILMKSYAAKRDRKDRLNYERNIDICLEQWGMVTLASSPLTAVSPKASKTDRKSMGESSGAVNRIPLRYEFEARISIGVQRGDTNLVVGGWARDISESGIRAFVAEELGVGEFVTLEVPLPN